MQFIRNDAVEAAFVTMMNKLIYGHKTILRPLLDVLRDANDTDAYRKVAELESRMEGAVERSQVLTGLMTKGYLEPALFNKEKNALETEMESLQRQKDSLSRLLNGNLAKTAEVSRLLKFAAKAEMAVAFNGDLFEEYVDRVVVYSRTEIGFELKCGLTLRERLVR